MCKTSESWRMRVLDVRLLISHRSHACVCACVRRVSVVDTVVIVRPPPYNTYLVYRADSRRAPTNDTHTHTQHVCCWWRWHGCCHGAQLPQSTTRVSRRSALDDDRAVIKAILSTGSSLKLAITTSVTTQQLKDVLTRLNWKHSTRKWKTKTTYSCKRKNTNRFQCVLKVSIITYSNRPTRSQETVLLKRFIS